MVCPQSQHGRLTRSAYRLDFSGGTHTAKSDPVYYRCTVLCCWLVIYGGSCAHAVAKLAVPGAGAHAPGGFPFFLCLLFSLSVAFFLFVLIFFLPSSRL